MTQLAWLPLGLRFSCFTIAGIKRSMPEDHYDYSSLRPVVDNTVDRFSECGLFHRGK